MFTDESRVGEFLNMLDDLNKTYIEVGILGTESADILMIASVHEFGCSIKVTDKMRGYLHHIGIHLKADTLEIKIPERSFIRAGYDENKVAIYTSAEDLLEKVVNLELSTDAFFNALGEYAVGLIQEYLTKLKDPPNHPATIANKKSSNPLIDTGQLRDSITYRVVRG